MQRNRDGSQEGRLGAWVDQEERGSPILEVDKELVSVRPAPTFKIPAYAFHSLVFIWISIMALYQVLSHVL